MENHIPLNFAILRNPWNWLIVILMVWIIGLALAIVFGPGSLPSPVAKTVS